MEIHKPKAAHGLREFLIEIGTIVCGILIALGLEQGLEALRERRTSAEAGDAVKKELSIDVALTKVRLDMYGCVSRHLADIGDLLIRAGNGTMAVQPTWISRPPLFTY